jgi:hypothetical protein
MPFDTYIGHMVYIGWFTPPMFVKYVVSAPVLHVEHCKPDEGAHFETTRTKHTCENRPCYSSRWCYLLVSNSLSLQQPACSSSQHLKLPTLHAVCLSHSHKTRVIIRCLMLVSLSFNQQGPPCAAHQRCCL